MCHLIVAVLFYLMSSFARLAAQPLVDISTLDKTAEVPAVKPAVHLVSTGNPKVGYPPLEMYSVPHRSNTFHGRPSARRGHEVVIETPAERTMHRITKRLAAVRTFPASVVGALTNHDTPDGNHGQGAPEPSREDQGTTTQGRRFRGSRKQYRLDIGGGAAFHVSQARSVRLGLEGY